MSNGNSSPLSEGRNGRPQLRHGVTEALEENESLLQKIQALEAENRGLRGQLKEVSQPRAASPQPGYEPADAIFRDNSLPASPAANPPQSNPKHLETVGSLGSMQQENSRLTAQVRSKDDENQALQDQVQALEESFAASVASARQLQDDLQHARKQVAMAEAQHLSDRSALESEKAKARSLDRNHEVSRLQDALAAAQRQVQQLEDQQIITASQAKQEAYRDDFAGLGGASDLAAELLANAGDEEEQEEGQQSELVRIRAPNKLAGHMQKKSPSTWRMLQPFQERFFVLEAGRLSWWECVGARTAIDHSHGDRCKGSLDFGINECTLEQQEDGKFSVRPKHGGWVAGNFTNSAQGRVLEFATTGSEHSFEDWCKAIREHIEHGNRRMETVASAIATAMFEDVFPGDSVNRDMSNSVMV